MRVGRQSLSFTEIVVQDRQEVDYEPYIVKSNISMAANLRQALGERLYNDNGQHIRLQVLVDTPALVVPIEQFAQDTAETLFRHAFPNSKNDNVEHNVMPHLNAVALFAVNKDFANVVADHFQHTTYIHAMTPVWRHLHQRSFTGHRSKLYGYFHDGQLDIFSFHQNRFKFCNTFPVTRGYDALYFLLYVWKQLQLKPEHDELHIVGDISEREWLVDHLRKYLEKAYVINPTADFNRAPASLITSMPFDLMTLLVKGR
mgnify:CR=1 FL=1